MIALPRRPVRLAHAWLVLFLAAFAGGCGTTLYISKIRAANEAFEQAKAVGAEEKSPYEYYGAEVRLHEAKKLAAIAEYGSAIRLADEARSLSETAVKNIETKARPETKAESTKDESGAKAEAEEP